MSITPETLTSTPSCWTQVKKLGTDAANSSIVSTIFWQVISSVATTFAIPLLCKTVVALAFLAIFSTPPAWITVAQGVGFIVLTYFAVKAFNWATQECEKASWMGWLNEMGSNYINNVDNELAFLGLKGAELITGLFGYGNSLPKATEEAPTIDLILAPEPPVDEVSSPTTEESEAIIPEDDLIYFDCFDSPETLVSHPSSTEELLELAMDPEDDLDYFDCIDFLKEEPSDDEFFDPEEGFLADPVSIHTEPPLINAHSSLDMMIASLITSTQIELFGLLFQMIGNIPPENWEDISTVKNPNTFQLTMQESLQKPVPKNLLGELIGESTVKKAKLANWGYDLKIAVTAPKTLTIALSKGTTTNEDGIELSYSKLHFPDPHQGFTFIGIPTYESLNLEEVKLYPNTNEITVTLKTPQSNLLQLDLESSIGNLEEALEIWQHIWYPQEH